MLNPTMPKADEWTRLTSLPKYEADLLIGRLKEAGIRSRTGRSPHDPSAWLTAYGNAVGLFAVYVPATETAAARQLLAGLSSTEHPGAGRPYHRLVQVVGRGLILVGLIAALLTGLVAMLDFR